ncbi:MAG: hypothetical protein JW741_29155 [Sedimentisphaerales bacterium]|nr:hypothetical protein [Sedimentisphaerales bacterium]
MLCRTLSSAIGVALVLAVFVCGCRPAWDPSGKTVVFPFLDGDTSGIAICDVESGKVKRLFEEPSVCLAAAQCIWTPDGKSILVAAAADDKSGRVLKINPVDGKTETVATIKDVVIELHQGVKLFTFQPPILVKDKFLWLGPLKKAGKPEFRYLRLDMTTGQVDDPIKDPNLEQFIFDFGKRGSYYIAKVANKADPKKNHCEFGTINLETGEHVGTPAGQETIQRNAPAEFVAAEPGGKRFARVLLKNLDPKPDDEVDPNEPVVALCIHDENGKIEKGIALPQCDTPTGDIVWAGDRVWVGVIIQDPKNVGQYSSGLYSIDVKTHKISSYILCKGDADYITFQPSASPDGKRLAVVGSLIGSGNKGAAKPQRPVALYLFDLTALQKGPTAIELPAK